MNDPFEPDINIKDSSESFLPTAVVITTHEDRGNSLTDIEPDLDVKDLFDKLIEENTVKDAIYQDFHEIIRNVFLSDEKDFLIRERCKEYKHIQYNGAHNVLVLESQLGCPSFCLMMNGKKRNEINMQETLSIIHKICEEKLAAEKEARADRISEIMKESKANYETVLQEFEHKRKEFEKSKIEHQEVKTKREESMNLLDSAINPVSLEGTEHTDMSNLDTETQLPQEIEIYEHTKQELENFEVKLASLKNNISILQKLHELALAGKLDKSSIISLNVSQLHQSVPQGQISAKQISISVGKFLEDYNVNSYHSYILSEQTIKQEKDAENSYTITLTDLPQREEEEKIENIQQEINQLKEKLIMREAIVSRSKD